MDDTYEMGNIVGKVMQDEDPENPRRAWDNFGTMVCFHRRYDLGDKHDIKHEDFSGWDEMEDYLRKEKGAVIVLPLFLYDHSGLRMKVGSFRGLLPQGHAEFDEHDEILVRAYEKIKDGATEEQVKDFVVAEIEGAGIHVEPPRELTEEKFIVEHDALVDEYRAGKIDDKTFVRREKEIEKKYGIFEYKGTKKKRWKHE